MDPVVTYDPTLKAPPKEFVRVAYENEAGEIVGYYSRLGLMTSKVERAMVIELGTGALGGVAKLALLLLDGPHPFDHLGTITTAVEELTPEED